MKTVEIIGGGTVYHVRNHLALAAPAYGTTAKRLYELCNAYAPMEYGNIHLHLTKMAGGLDLETNEDVSKFVDKMVGDKSVRIIFFNPALVDFDGSIMKAQGYEYDWNDVTLTMSGKYEERLKTSEGRQQMALTPAPKILSKIRKERKDIFLVAFKTTCGASEDEQFLAGLNLLKANSCNLVLANDTKTRTNMIITPEQARYSVTKDREQVLTDLIKMTVSRAGGHFTRSIVVPGDPVAWDTENIPISLKSVVEYCIDKGAYKPFKGSTVGHFAFKKSDKEFITSKRRVNFNNLKEVGMVKCEATGDNKVIAYGAKPSVGGQSQRIIFKEHPEMDCIVHFHCPPLRHPDSMVHHDIPVRSQFENECGSHECGKNTSRGLKEVEQGIKCVYLDNHGPNIVFNRNIDPQKVIMFIEKNFDLSKSTDGVDRSKVQVP